ncbi:hypothetical protein GCM10028804_51050 [Larkinella terrae]
MFVAGFWRLIQEEKMPFTAQTGSFNFKPGCVRQIRGKELLLTPGGVQNDAGSGIKNRHNQNLKRIDYDGF